MPSAMSSSRSALFPPCCSPRLCSRRQPLASGKHQAAVRGDAELEALRDHPGLFNEMLSRGSGTDVLRRRREESEPLVEMRRVDGKWRMRLHRPPVIAAGHQRD